MNLEEYKTYYVNDEGHWYISKIKQYDEESINIMAKGLCLFTNLLSPSPDRNTLERFNKFKPKQFQIEMSFIQSPLIPVNDNSTLFLSLEILANGLVDLSHLEQTHKKKHITFTQIYEEFNEGNDYTYFVNKYRLDYLRRELTIYYRNFFSWLSKYGFIGIQEFSKLCFFTDAGIEFSRNSDNMQTTSALFRNQIRKVQVWNPTLPLKYKDFKVIPYYVILELLTLLPENEFTRNEYVLFVTKIKSHTKDDIIDACDLIKEFRNLSDSEQSEYIDEIEADDHARFPNRSRTNFARLNDSSGKEINAYTFGGHIIIQNSIIRLLDVDQASKELALFQNSPKYIEFQSKQDWIMHLGSLDGLNLDDIIDIYVRSGKSIEEITEILRDVEEDISVRVDDRFLESEVETYYVQNIQQISRYLEVVQKPKPGRQFYTDIGIIDTLCKDNETGEYVVVEFKRAQVSDDTIGQVLRYMGWVSLNLNKGNKKVRGVIVGRDFSEKLLYSIFGVQENSFLELLKLYTHPFDKINRPNIGERI